MPRRLGRGGSFPDDDEDEDRLPNPLRPNILRDHRRSGLHPLLKHFISSLRAKGLYEEEDVGDVGKWAAKMIEAWEDGNDLSMGEIQRMYCMEVLRKGRRGSKDLFYDLLHRRNHQGEMSSSSSSSDAATMSARMTAEFFEKDPGTRFILDHMNLGMELAAVVGFPKGDVQSGFDLLQSAVMQLKAEKEKEEEAEKERERRELVRKTPAPFASTSTFEDPPEIEESFDRLEKGRKRNDESGGGGRGSNGGQEGGFEKMKTDLAWKLKEHNEKRKKISITREEADSQALGMVKVLQECYTYNELVKIYFNELKLADGDLENPMTEMKRSILRRIGMSASISGFSPKETYEIVEITVWFFKYARKNATFSQKI